jgi:hypothetical protein
MTVPPALDLPSLLDDATRPQPKESGAASRWLVVLFAHRRHPRSASTIDALIQ